MYLVECFTGVKINGLFVKPIAQEKHIVIIKALIHIERSSLEERSLDSDLDIYGSIPDFVEMDIGPGDAFHIYNWGRARLRFR